MASMAVKRTAISSLHIAKFTILFLIFRHKSQIVNLAGLVGNTEPS
jgi:hypothetical protein